MSGMIVMRRKYLDRLLEFRDEDLIKVVTGVRRCGKSTLLEMMRGHLIESGVPESRTVMLNMESLEFGDLPDYRALYKLIREKIDGVTRPYIFLDELQDVRGWEKAVNSLRVDVDCDIYITGSNAFLLSSELSTRLSGRYVEIEMLPLSFAEYLDFRKADLIDGGENGLALLEDGTPVPLSTLFAHYRRYGGFPFLASREPDRDRHQAYCKSLYDTVIVRDILERDRRRKQSRLTNPALLERICAFLSDNVGNENSVNSIAGAVRTEAGTAANSTVDGYIRALCEAYLFYPVQRYDIKGKQLLKTNGKHYIVDPGLRNYLDDYRDSDIGRTLENIVFLQLKYDGYSVSVGKIRDVEVDFIARRGTERIYIQVTDNMYSDNTMERELRPLKAINDAFPKLVVVGEGTHPENVDGIRIVGAVDFLLGLWR